MGISRARRASTKGKSKDTTVTQDKGPASRRAINQNARAGGKVAAKQRRMHEVDPKALHRVGSTTPGRRVDKENVTVLRSPGRLSLGGILNLRGK